MENNKTLLIALKFIRINMNYNPSLKRSIWNGDGEKHANQKFKESIQKIDGESVKDILTIANEIIIAQRNLLNKIGELSEILNERRKDF